MRQIDVHPEAYDELEQTRSWYESHMPGLGSDFLDAVERAIDIIRQAPEAWPVYVGDVRRFLIHRFPFAVLYRHDDFKIRIYAIAHLRRKPGYWKHRKFS
jgi:hypothetical protein